VFFTWVVCAGNANQETQTTCGCLLAVCMANLRAVSFMIIC